jgi:hypothetical protein
MSPIFFDSLTSADPPPLPKRNKQKLFLIVLGLSKYFQQSVPLFRVRKVTILLELLHVENNI